MPLPASPPIYLKTVGASTGIQDEFSAANLAAASTAAGLDPLPTSMLDFLGKSQPVSLSSIDLAKFTHLVALPNAIIPDCNIFIYFETNGNIYTRTGQGYDEDQGSWYTPETAGVGNSYFIRFTLLSVINNSGAGNTYAGSTGWQSLAAQKFLGVGAGSAYAERHIEVSYFVEIASDISGSNIISSATFVLEALVTLIS